MPSSKNVCWKYQNSISGCTSASKLVRRENRSLIKEPLIKSHVAATAAFGDSAAAGGASAVRPGGGAALAPLRTFRGATVRERTREARCSQWPFPLASRATKQTGRKGAPDSVSRSVVGEGAQSCCKKHRKTGCSCCRSRTPSFADRVAAAPDSVSHSVVREGAQAAARDTVKRGAHAAAPAPQASLTVSRAPRTRSRAAWCGKGRKLPQETP